ncbi:MAG: hypothetical protein WCI62_04145 [Erysipelotrichaceae bacterium]
MTTKSYINLEELFAKTYFYIMGLEALASSSVQIVNIKSREILKVIKKRILFYITPNVSIQRK